MIRVAIVDDHQVVSEGFVALLNTYSEEIEVVGTAKNSKELLILMTTHEVDVVTLDIHMPDSNAQSTIKALREQYPNCQILMLTMEDKAQTIQSCLNQGAAGYLMKNCSGEELTKAISIVAQRQRYLSTEVTGILADFALDQDKKIGTPESQRKLTKKEKECLARLAMGLSRTEVAGQMFISLGTVHQHFHNISKKLGGKNAAGLVAYAKDHNITLESLE